MLGQGSFGKVFLVRKVQVRGKLKVRSAFFQKFLWSSQQSWLPDLCTKAKILNFPILICLFQGKDTGTLYAMKVLKKATLKVFVYSK